MGNTIRFIGSYRKGKGAWLRIYQFGAVAQIEA